jgi:hypothetical protein
VLLSECAIFHRQFDGDGNSFHNTPESKIIPIRLERRRMAQTTNAIIAISLKVYRKKLRNDHEM